MISIWCRFYKCELQCKEWKRAWSSQFQDLQRFHPYETKWYPSRHVSTKLHIALETTTRKTRGIHDSLTAHLQNRRLLMRSRWIYHGKSNKGIWKTLPGPLHMKVVTLFSKFIEIILKTTWQLDKWLVD